MILGKLTGGHDHAGRNFVAAILGGLILLWPSLLNGYPFLLADTTAYVRGADASVYGLTGYRTAWSQEHISRQFQNSADAETPQQRSRNPDIPAPSPVVLLGRSVYYGAGLYFSYLLGSLWFMAVFQSVLVSLIVVLTLARMREPQRAFQPIAVLALLAVLTPVGYFAAYLIPDIFAPLAILSFAHLAIYGDRYSKWGRAGWFALLTAALLFHMSHQLLIASMLILALAISLLKVTALRPRGLFLPVLALFASFGGGFAFSAGVDHFTGNPPVTPPFLTARLVAAGPGYDYLMNTCPNNGFYICRYKDTIPRDSNYFLWSKARPEGLFSAIPDNERRNLAAEQSRFVIAVTIDRPVQVAIASLSAVVDQIALLDLSVFNYTATARERFDGKLPPEVRANVQQSAAYLESMPTYFVERAALPVTVLSLIAIAIAALVRSNEKPSRSALVFAGVVVMGVLINDFICGALSAPSSRYQMRVIWLLPLLAISLWPLSSFSRVHQAGRDPS